MTGQEDSANPWILPESDVPIWGLYISALNTSPIVVKTACGKLEIKPVYLSLRSILKCM